VLRQKAVLSTALLGILLWGCGPAQQERALKDGSPEAVSPATFQEPKTDPAVRATTESSAGVTTADLEPDELPPGVRPCWGCHEGTVRQYLSHGMASTAGPPGKVPPGTVVHPESGNRYEISDDGDGTSSLLTTLPDGGQRRQKIVGRIGAGRLDVSWATAEVDQETGQTLGRLFFAPVELITGHGWELSPFEVNPPSAGPDFGLTADCLTCHVTQDLRSLPGAEIFPSNQLGAEALEHLQGLSCEACHGDTKRHRALMAGLEEPTDPRNRLGLERLSDWSPAAQLDVCAQCHLQGDARLELTDDKPDRNRPLAGQLPVMVTARATDDFRFVSQVDRLSLSPCFQQSPEMTCTTCHDAHLGTLAQGIESFDQVCADCHQDSCNRPASLAVEEVTGEAPRTAQACVDCHMRSSQPFDLPHVRSGDHWIRRRIPLPEEVPHRAIADEGGSLEIFGRDRLAQPLATSAGRLWEQGVLAIGLASLGRVQEAAAHFDAFPPPGSPEAVQASAPEGLEPLETRPAFHETRALALLAQGRPQEAFLAYGDALTVAPLSPGALLGRARLAVGMGDVRTMLIDSQALIETFPQAEQPWELRLMFAERAGRTELALEALREATRAWPSNGTFWWKLGLLEQQNGNAPAATRALDRARQLQPSLFDQ